MVHGKKDKIDLTCQILGNGSYMDRTGYDRVILWLVIGLSKCDTFWDLRYKWKERVTCLGRRYATPGYICAVINSSIWCVPRNIVCL